MNLHPLFLQWVSLTVRWSLVLLLGGVVWWGMGEWRRRCRARNYRLGREQSDARKRLNRANTVQHLRACRRRGYGGPGYGLPDDELFRRQDRHAGG